MVYVYAIYAGFCWTAEGCITHIYLIQSPANWNRVFGRVALLASLMTPV